MTTILEFIALAGLMALIYAALLFADALMAPLPV